MRPTSLRSSLSSLSRPGTGTGTGTSTGAGLRTWTGTGTGLFYCPSCAATWRRRARRSLSHINNGILAQPRGNPAAPCISGFRQFTTSTSTNTSTVPPRFRELHAALNRVGETATDRLDLSRLQLALRGLEVEEPLVRVAILGLNDTTAGRRLVRLLLSDPLAPKEDWEGLLNGSEADISQGLLIRYGEKSQSIPNNLLPTITIPSPLLQKGNLEILVTSLGAETLPSSPVSADTFLVPTVTIRTSRSGRHNVVRYPVHRSIVCGSGVDDLLAYSSLIGRSDLGQEATSVYGAIDLPVSGEKKTTQNNDRVAFVDINQAEEALDKFRESVQHATLFERGWLDSGVMPVVNWLASMRNDEGKGQLLDPSLRTLIVSLLDAAEEGVQAKEAQRQLEQAAASVSEETRVELQRTVAEWAERAHLELRSSLDAGFASTRWKGLAWWKLFWRVDDVGMITSEILERRFLSSAEREVIWTAGQFQQAGLVLRPETESSAATATSWSKLVAAAPWPRQISTSRSHLLGSTVPALQALAQRLVLFSMSTTTLTSALSALTYISVPSATVYETCTMAAVGVIYSLRRQQTRWETARTFWEDEVRDEGRAALRATEEELHSAVRDSRPSEVILEIEAREGIEQARRAIEFTDSKTEDEPESR